MNWKKEYSEEFDKLRKNRVEVSYYKYGSASCPYHMYDLLQDSVKVDYMKDAILSMIQLLNERIEKWPDEDTEIMYDYVGRISSHEDINEQ